MSKVKYLIVLFLFMCINTSVYALSCPNSVTKDLVHAATYIKANYDVIDNSETKTLTIGSDSTTYTIPNYTFEMSIYNITEDFTAEIHDDVSGNTISIGYNDTNDGTYSFTNSDFGTIYNYTIKIMSNKNECLGQLVKTLHITKPKYNAYSEYTYCKNSTILVCQKFVTKDIGVNSSEEFLKKISVNNKKNAPINISDETKKTIKDIFSNNWILFASIFAGVIIISIGVIIYIKKKNKTRGWDL